MNNNWKQRLRKSMTRALAGFLGLALLATSLPLPDPAFAEVNQGAKVDYNDIAGDKEKFVNKLPPVKPAKPADGQTAEDLIKNPKQPAIYTLRTDFKAQKGEKYAIRHQPYIASVGAAASDAEKAKVHKTMKLPDLAGYEKPQRDFTIDYDTVKNAAEGKNKTGDDTNGFRYRDEKDFLYNAKPIDIKIKHVFQKLDDFTKYTNPDGSVGDDGELITTQSGNTGSTMQVSPLGEKDPRRKGFVPEAKYINMQVPENAENFILEYRYNRAHYDVVFDTAGGTALPSRTLYYEQVIPKIADGDIPTKVGGTFLGWKPSVDISTKDGKTYKANEIIAVGTGQAIQNLDANLIMPASNVTFTAVWKDNEKADYAVQFWAEKADHADGASLQEKYEYMGTRVYKDADTGFRPNLDNEPVKDIVFPDLDQARLQKIWNGDKFYADRYLYLNKFFVYNKDLTHDQNKDSKNVNLVKSVDSTGRTVYNIYYDRQVYDLYFTKSNALGDKETFYPSIYVPDGEGGAKLAGGPGNPYHYKARFNQLMLGWPNDAMQTKGFDEGKQSYGWGPNYGVPNWPLHLDTPPYRLNADEFLDMPNYDNWGGYVSQIDKGDGTTINVNNDPRYKDAPYKALSFGIKQDKGSMPHHMDFWMDGFKPGETIIRYDLYRSKADTNSLTYGHKYSHVQGFTPYNYKPGGNWPTIEEGSEENGRVDEDGIGALNEERGEVTPYPNKNYTDTFGFNNALGQMVYRHAFFNTADEFGDPLKGVTPFKENGYIRFKYHRNKYPLRFNTDPSKIKDDSEFGSTNQLDTFYQFPLKALSPDVDDNNEYQKVDTKEGPKNLLDNPENLQKLGLTELVFTDPKDGKLKVKRPEGLSDQMVFKGWALDPAGTKLIWENPKETMPTHPVHLFAKWGEPDYKWKVTFDPDGGALDSIDEGKLTQKRKTIQEGDIGQEETNTYAKKEANEGDKQVFTVIQRQKLVEPKKPTKKGYDFMGWEVVHYKKDANGDYTNEIDNSYRETYKVPELYSFGNDVVSPIYLKAIWVPNQLEDIKVEHYKLDKDYNLDTSVEENPKTEYLRNKRTNYPVATTGDKQDETWLLASHEELDKNLTGDLRTNYEEYNNRVKLNNTFFQTFRVEPEKIEENGQMVDNPKFKDNVFKFFYRKFRTRDYKVNYVDERFKDQGNEKEGAIIAQEAVSNGNRHFDARNYRPIPGWKLVSAPQQQLFFDVNEDTNEFKGINGTGKDEITFYYKDVRVIEVPKDGKTPEGYVRVTFKAEKGGSFGKDAQGNPITELNYDVIKGLKSDLLPVPKELAEGETVDKDKHYITPDTGKKFIKWDNKPLLNDNTIIENEKKDFYVFTAQFEWSGLSASGLVKTEAFKDKSGKWTNDFAPTIEDLKKQLVWKENEQVKPLPEGAKIQFFDEAGNEITKDDQVYDLVNEKKVADKDELVRTVKIKAKVTFTDGKDPQELDIPITVYKNVYEALNKAGDKPLFLKEAEGKEAKDGGLKDILKDNTENRYIKVTIKPTRDMDSKDDKVYFVNPNAWVEIPEVKPDGSTTFINWTADKTGQNDDGAENGNFDFGKRHKFTEDTVISPRSSANVIEQTDPNKKPDTVPSNFVEVKFVPTDKATDETKADKIFWVNPKREVTIPVKDPVGKQYFTFKEWKIGVNGDGETYTPTTAKKFTAATTITATYDEAKNIIPYDPKEPTTRPDGYVRVTFAAEKGLSLTEQKAYYVKKNAGITLGDTTLAKPAYEAQTGYEFEKWDKEDTTKIEATDIVVTAKATVLKDVDTENHPDYVKVTFKAGANGVIKENGNKVDEQVYYVNPNKYVNLPAPTPEGNTGYDFAAWSSDQATGDFSLANFVNYTKDTVITANFNQKDAVYPKLDGSTKPAGYVEVTFAISGTGGKIADSEVKTYYVDPTRQVSLKAPKTMAGTGFIFDKWRLGKNPTDQTINPADQKQYAVDTTIYGSFTKLKDIIPSTNDDGTPNLQPIDYVAVLFIGGDHANKVDGQILYYVNPKVDPAQTIGDLTKPTVTPDTGWKHTGWDVQDSTVIKDYTFVVAQYEALDDVVPALKDDGTPNDKPEGYVKVTFKSGANGKIQEKGSDITEKVYYVNPAKYVKLTPPTTVPNTSYEFSTWCSDGKNFILANNINFTKDTIITAKFNAKNDVIPKTKNDDSEKPKGFVTVTFVIDPTEAGEIEAGQTTTYFVRPNTDVTIHPPKAKAETGYEFDKWDPDTTEAKQYATDTTVKGKFTKLDEIIPSKNPDGTVNAQPEGYVIVNFLKGDHGVLDGKTTFYVNPKAGKKLKDLDTSGITVVPSPTYKFDKWDKAMDTPITGPDNINVTATYSQLPDIIKAGPKDTAPAGYVVIIFETDGRGTITGNAAYEKTSPASKENEIVYFVNPKKGIKLAKLADGATPAADQLAIPSTTPNDKYIFDQWRADIDTNTPITRGRVHIAMFKPEEVTLTYDANGATGDVPPALTVDYDTNVRLANKGNLAKKDASFKGWKIGDKIYQAGDQINLKENTTAYAQWTDDKNIIEYDPVNNPTTRPDDTYVRVTFAAEDGLKLTDQKAYYVKKDAGIKLAQLTKPTYEVKTGYVFKEWDKADADTITTDILVTAKATKLGTVIPEKDTNGNTNAKPEGYKEVVFVVKAEEAAKGSLEGVTKFYVNPAEYVTINPPTTKANTGFEFGAWDKDATRPTVYNDDVTTITGSFNGLKDLIPKTKDDESEKPTGYKTVTFEIVGDGGSIVDKETTVYFVNPAKAVTVPQPKTIAETGYEFEKWDQDTATAKKYAEDTTVKGNFKTLEDIIPSTDANGNSNAEPDGYITVTFDKGEHGTLSGQKVYYVNPKAGKTLADITKPTAKAETGWKVKGWDKADTEKITGPEDITVTALYDRIPYVIPKDKPIGGENEKPDGYITVTFEKGDHGSLEGTTVFYIDPNTPVVLKDKKPIVNPDTGYDFVGWDVSIDKAIQYKDGDKITALYNEPRTISMQEVKGYVKVIFDKGASGTLDGTTEYWIKPDVRVNIPEPKVNPYVGYKFKGWNNATTITAKPGDKPHIITAKYEEIGDVIPQINKDGSDRPDGYVTVTFKAKNGSLEGTTTYYVNGDIEVDLTSTADAIKKKADLGYTADGGTWDKSLKAKFKDGDVLTFTFKALDDVIKATPGATKPDGYVTVKFIPTDKATDATKAETSYWVNPKKENVTIPSTDPSGKEFTDANGNTYTFIFKQWSSTRGVVGTWKKDDKVTGTFTQDTEIEAKYNIKAEKLIEGPIAKDGVVTPKGDVPKAEDLIKNPYDPTNPDSKDNLPKGTTFSYKGGDPNLSEPGKTTVVVEVHYPNGKTAIVNVPITVVDNVVPQMGDEKPKVPDSYVKVTVDTTDTATPNTMFKKVFWVKPDVEVTIPGILAPTGKEVTKDGVTKTNNFDKWQRKGDPTKSYAGEIKDTFTDKETTIIAQYTEKETKPGSNTGGSSGGSGSIVVPPTPQPTPEKPSEGDLNKDDHYQYLIGYPDGTFAPNRGMTRAEVATMFTRLLKDRPVKWLHYSAGLSDIYAGDWYADTVGYAVQKGIVSGYPDGTFKPNQPITRAEFASIASRFAQLTDEQDISFIDLDASHWGYKAVRSAASHGWISGYPDGSFRPEQAISRAEVTSITNRMLNRYADLDWIDAHRDEVIRFSDVGRSDWYFEPVMEATMGHDFTRDADGKTEHWTGLNGKTFI